MIAGMLKSEMNMTMDYILYDLSYENLIMLSSSIPSFSGSGKNKEEEKISADDPRNMERIKQLTDN